MRIIVVDDETNNVCEIDNMIQRYGKAAEVICFTNPIEALEASKNEIFDVAFLDIQMPVISGIELAQQIAGYHPNIKIIFITAYNHYATEAFEVNAVDYLLKPLRYERFEKTFNKLFTKKGDKAFDDEKLFIKVFGDVTIAYGNNKIKWNRPKAYELFSYLLLRKSTKVHKEIICEDLWPELDGKRALANLQVTMSRLRRDLACLKKEQIFIEYNRHYYIMYVGEAWFDLDEFILLSQSSDVESMQRALSIYCGELFDQESWKWLLEFKEYYRKKYEEFTLNLIKYYYEAEDWHAIIQIVEAYILKGLPDDMISQYYLDAIHELNDSQKDKEAGKRIENWYNREIDMPMPKTIKIY